MAARNRDDAIGTGVSPSPAGSLRQRRFAATHATALSDPHSLVKLFLYEIDGRGGQPDPVDSIHLSIALGPRLRVTPARAPRIGPDRRKVALRLRCVGFAFVM